MQQVVVNLQPAKEEQQAFLVAYYQAKSPVARQQLQDYLVTLLPDYMLPSAYMYLPEIPLNMNGKVDRKALPQVQAQDKAHYVAPETSSSDACASYSRMYWGAKADESALPTTFLLWEATACRPFAW